MAILDIDKVIADFWYDNFHKRNPNYVVDNSDVVVDMVEFTYDPVNAVREPRLVASTTYNNGTDAQATQTLTNTDATTSTFTWGLQEGIKLGAKTSGTAARTGDSLVMQPVRLVWS